MCYGIECIHSQRDDSSFRWTEELINDGRFLARTETKFIASFQFIYARIVCNM